MPECSIDESAPAALDKRNQLLVCCKHGWEMPRESKSSYPVGGFGRPPADYTRINGGAWMRQPGVRKWMRTAAAEAAFDNQQCFRQASHKNTHIYGAWRRLRAVMNVNTDGRVICVLKFSHHLQVGDCKITVRLLFNVGRPTCISVISFHVELFTSERAVRITNKWH
jgi:hypothetical protein